MAYITPSMFAGHDVSCPYEFNGVPVCARRMAYITPSMCAGHSMLSPYEFKGEGCRVEKTQRPAATKAKAATASGSRRVVDITPSICAGHSMLCPYNGNGAPVGGGGWSESRQVCLAGTMYRAPTNANRDAALKDAALRLNLCNAKTPGAYARAAACSATRRTIFPRAWLLKPLSKAWRA